MFTSRYFIFIAAITFIILFLHSLSLFNGIQQQKSLEKTFIDTNVKTSKQKNDIISSCYRAENLTTCINFNGIYFNSSSFPPKKLIEFDKEVFQLAKRGKFYTHRLFMNTKIDNDANCENKLAEAYCEIALRTLHELWSCHQDIPQSNQFYQNEKIYYPDTTFFGNTLPVPLDERDRILVNYLNSINLADVRPTWQSRSKTEDISFAYCNSINDGLSSNETYSIDLLEYQIKSAVNKKSIMIIHIDKNLPESIVHIIHSIVEKYREEGMNIHLMPLRYSYTWGSSSQLYIQLSCMAYLFLIEQDNPDIRWDYFINLSGYDFPIKRLNDAQKIMSKRKEKSFLEYYPGTSHDLSQRYHPRRVILECKKEYPVSAELQMELLLKEVEYAKIEKFIQTTPKYLKSYSKGSPWFIMHRDHLWYFLSSIKSDDILSIKYTFSPDEVYIHTLLSNSWFIKEISKNNLRMEGAKIGPACFSCQDLSAEQWPILKSSGAIVARKVVSTDLAKIIHDWTNGLGSNRKDDLSNVK